MFGHTLRTATICVFALAQRVVSEFGVLTLTNANDCFSDQCMLDCAQGYDVSGSYASGELTLESTYEDTQCECATGSATYENVYTVDGSFGDPVDIDFSAEGDSDYSDIVVTINQCDVTYEVQSGCVLTVGDCTTTTTSPSPGSCMFGADVGAWYLVWLFGPVVLVGIILGAGKGCAMCKESCARSAARGSDFAAVVWQCDNASPCCLMRCPTCRSVTSALQVVTTLILFINGCLLAMSLSSGYFYQSFAWGAILAIIAIVFALWNAVLNTSQVFAKAPPFYARRHLALMVLDCGVVIFAAFFGIATSMVDLTGYDHVPACGANLVIWSLLCLACSIASLVVQSCLCCKYREHNSGSTALLQNTGNDGTV